MTGHLNLDDAGALRVRYDARVPGLFNAKREPQVIRLPKTRAGTGDEKNDFCFLKTEDVMDIGRLRSLDCV